VIKVNRLAWSAIAVLAASALVGCGSGSSGAKGGVEGATIKIGVSSPLSGPLATAGTATKCGVQAYLQSVNDSGGIDDYKFEIHAVDNQYDPGIAASVARGFATDGTFAVVIAGTSTMEASVPILKARDIPVFGSPDGATLTPPEWEGLFGYNPVYEQEGASAVPFVRETLGLDKAASVFLSPAAQPASDAFVKAFKKSGGEVVANEALSPEITDYAPIAQKLKSSGAPVVYTTLVDTQLAGLQKASDAVGYKPKWVSWTIAQGPTYLDLAGDLAEDVYFSQWAIPETQTDDPAVQKYVKAVNSVKDCEELVGDTAVKTGYALGAAIVHGVEQATADGAKLEPDAFIEALSDVKDQQFGLTPHMTYDAKSHSGVRQNSYWQVKGGELKMVRDFELLPRP
jgi:branched-chain amino acid transport system substrate-binding protein